MDSTMLLFAEEESKINKKSKTLKTSLDDKESTSNHNISNNGHNTEIVEKD